MESKLPGLCWQIADALIRWMKLIEAKHLLGVEWGVWISAGSEGTKKKDTKPGLSVAELIVYPWDPGCKEIYVDELVNQEWIIWDER
jgi:hypothetical protein